MWIFLGILLTFSALAALVLYLGYRRLSRSERMPALLESLLVPVLQRVLQQLGGTLPTLLGGDFSLPLPRAKPTSRPAAPESTASEPAELEPKREPRAGTAPPPGMSATSASPVAPAGSESRAGYVEVPVYFGTDRVQTGSTKPAERLGSAPGDLSWGRLTVSIPDTHVEGQLERPQWWKLQFREHPDRFVSLLSLELLPAQEFFTRATEDLAKTERKEALLFVHGFANTFHDAALRTAQLSYDLQFDGLALLYSWPSQGGLRPLDYTADEASVGRSEHNFLRFLERISRDLGVSTIHIVAHSMGNRLLTSALQTLALRPLPPPHAEIRQVVFAAPDVDAVAFRNLAAAFQGTAKGFTLYASAADKALKASKQVHRQPRAGDTEPEPVVVAGVDTVDATPLAVDWLGHSSFANSPVFQQDIFSVIRHGHSPPDRRLRSVNIATGRYWQFWLKAPP